MYKKILPHSLCTHGLRTYIGGGVRRSGVGGAQRDFAQVSGPRHAIDGGGFLATRLHTATGPHRVKLACESMLAPMEASRQKQLSLLLLPPPSPMLLPPSCRRRRRRRSAPCVEAEIQMTCGKAHRFPCFSKASHTHKHSTAQASTTYYVHTYLLTRLNND